MWLLEKFWGLKKLFLFIGSSSENATYCISVSANERLTVFISIKPIMANFMLEVFLKQAFVTVKT